MTILSFCLNLVISHVTHVTATLQQHIRLSRLYTGIYTSESLDDLKQVLADYYAAKVQQEADRLWDEGILDATL